MSIQYILFNKLNKIIINYYNRENKQQMKQISLFDSFSKKGTPITKTKSSSQNRELSKNDSQILKTNCKEQQVQSNLKQKNLVHKLSNQDNMYLKKKNNKRTLDSDDEQCLNPKKVLQFQEYQIKNITAQDDQNQIKTTKNNKQKTMKRQYQSQMESQQLKSQIEQQVPTKTQNKKSGVKQIKDIVPPSNMKQKSSSKIDEQNPLSQFTDATPIWAQKQHCKDAQKRSVTHPDYDGSTLYVPQGQWSKFTAPMRQFWKIKSQNFDKIVLFKLGKFYQIFYDDAAITNKYLNLKFMGTKMHTGFPQKCLQKYTEQLIKLGFKVVVVQQMQTPQQMNERVQKDKQKGVKSQKTIHREVTQILTKGTMPYNQQRQNNYLPNYLMSLRIHDGQYAFSLLQIGTNEVAMGTVNGIQNFKTILYQTRPIEVVFDPDNIPNQIVQMLQKSFLQMQISKLPNKHNLWHPLTARNQIQRLQKQNQIKTPKIFQNINGMNDTTKNLLYSTLSGMFDYLKKVFRFDYVIGTARFVFYQKDHHMKSMILDSQALQHLQIFQTAQGQNGSLFNVIDRTKTKFGKRLLRRWIMSPLISIQSLNQRLNALQDLQQNALQRNKISNILKKLPDLQKKANKLYHYAVKNTSASKAVYFEDIHVNRLKQFKQFMQKMQCACQAATVLQRISSNFKSNRLKRIVTLDPNQRKIKDQNAYYDEQEQQENNIGILPNVMANLQQFKSYIKWQGNTPVPQKGLVQYYDQLQNQCQRIKSSLQKYIDELRYQLNQPNLKFVHTKQRYQIQIPEKSERKRPGDFQFTSKRAGFSRYISPTIKKFVKQLEKCEQNLKQQLGHFVGFFFEQFKKKHTIWHKFIQIIGQIDCLISLSEYSYLNNKTRPHFCEQNKFQIKKAYHPCLTGIQFIPNDIIMDRKIMLLTGPNMGGKSTVLRTACTLAILAQIGCYVPAECYQCSPVDRIFTRIGASDKLQLGKSTFFIQMQQTRQVITQGTNRSLAIIDQLGRGTSTFDGLSIAYSVLKDITERIKCFCLFATHYHMLLSQFKNNPQISLMKMDTIIKYQNQEQQNSKNKYDNEIVFLYKLVPGNVDISFGLNVARKVGIKKQTIKMAEKQAHLMNKYIQSKQKSVLTSVMQFINQQTS